MTGPLISCIIPVYNGEDYLGEAIESVLQQSWKALEIVVSDDGSTDGSREVARSYGTSIRLIAADNAGHAAARNRGIAASSGELLAFLDADDRWHPGKLALQMERFRQRPETDIIVGLVQNFWDEGLGHEEERFQGHRILQPIMGYVPGVMLAKREAFATVGPFNETLAHADAMEWFIRCREKGLVVEALQEVLLYRRIHAANRSRLLQDDSREEYLELIKSVLDRRRNDPGSRK